MCPPPRWPNKLECKTYSYIRIRALTWRVITRADCTCLISLLRYTPCHFCNTEYDLRFDILAPVSVLRYTIIYRYLRFNTLAPELVAPAIQDGIHYTCPMPVLQCIVGSFQTAACSKHATNLRLLLKRLARP